MKKCLIAGNWKMNKSIAEARAFAEALRDEDLRNASQLAILAPYTQLQTLSEALADTDIRVGAQNVHYAESGAYTGEISVPMLQEIGVSLCVVGHSERRSYYAETDDAIKRKIQALLAANMSPILCVGESLETREAGQAMRFVGDQLAEDLDGLTAADAAHVVIAYEPIWAIGTGRTATPDQAEEMCAFIRGMLEGLFGKETAAAVIIQYGGSMKPANAKALLEKPNIDGGLIGGASLEVASLLEILRVADALD